jgi:hypothetical protein
MKPYLALLALCTGASLLVACPSDPGGVAEDDSTGPEPTAGTTTMNPTSGVDTTEPDTTTTSTTTDPDETAPPPGCVADEDCDNGLFCDGEETCEAGECVPGTPPECAADEVECTVEECNEELDACIQRPDNSLCGCAETCHPELGCGDYCVPTICINQVYQCGNCIDDDGDCLVDSYDPDCWGPCDNNEGGWQGNVPGQQNQPECNVMDCYFDQNSGAGNDNCYWSHACDPLEPGGACPYDGNYTPPGSGNQDCSQLAMMQSETCSNVCGSLVPNGCDCFGCCEVQVGAETVTVYIGSHTPDDVGTCNPAVVQDPDLCWPCTQVPGCLNACDECELCIGQSELPPGCTEQQCPAGLQACGLPGQDPCPLGQACVTGCCVPNPQ